jgi:SAM-dependent methyltransferase
MWKEFIEITKNRKPWPLVLEAISYVKSPIGKHALDLGCGGGVDTIALSNAGFIVDAIDSEPTASNIFKNNPDISSDSVKLIIKPMEHFDFSNKNYDFVVAWNSLPFIKKEDAMELIKSVINSLNSGGVFVFSVFGENDGFVKEGKACVFYKDELIVLLDGMTPLHFEEIERGGHTASGEIKHWHFFTGIVQKPLSLIDYMQTKNVKKAW